MISRRERNPFPIVATLVIDYIRNGFPIPDGLKITEVTALDVKQGIEDIVKLEPWIIDQFTLEQQEIKLEKDKTKKIPVSRLGLKKRDRDIYNRFVYIFQAFDEFCKAQQNPIKAQSSTN